MTSWWKWRDEVVEQVRFWPDRTKIAEELDAHYEDHVKDLERIGFDHELAEKRALQAMGDAAEVGRAMDQAHRPGLGWLWLASKGIAILALVSLFLMCVSDGRWQHSFMEPVQREGDYEPDGYSYFSPGSWERENAVRLWTGEGESTVERDGDIFSIPYAAIWKCHYPASHENRYQAYNLYWVTIILAADDKNPFDRRFNDFIDSVTCAWQDGRFYTGDYGVVGLDEKGKGIWGPGEGYFNCNLIESDMFRTLYYMRSCLGETPPGEWSEISYEIGEPWSIRINWEEVAP